MRSEGTLLGAVLAGGRSRRFGSDKSALPFAGEPLWRRQLGVLRAAGATETVLVLRPDQAAPAGVRCRWDRLEGVGPLAGLEAALVAPESSFVAVLAVDMPGIDADWFRWLQTFCRPGTGAMARQGGLCEPLAAIYPAEAIGEIETRLARHDHSLQPLARALAAQGLMTLVPLDARRARCVASINTADQWEEWKRGAGPSPSG